MIENITRGALVDQVRVHSMPDFYLILILTLLFILYADARILGDRICSFAKLANVKFSLTAPDLVSGP